MSFSPEHYQQQLSQLTINSRALITELTTLAESHVEHSTEISEMVENRIKRALPQHKLYSVYLLDSICKNIGNPYNVIFGSKLFRIFTETYSIVTDTPTRQHLIDLFKTWVGGKTTAGGELFPLAVLQRIEKFIIQATLLGETNNPDVLLKEGRALLHAIIQLDDKDDLVEVQRNRGILVAKINDISDCIVAEMREGAVEKRHARELADIRRDVFEQQARLGERVRARREKAAQDARMARVEEQVVTDRERHARYLAENEIVLGGVQKQWFDTIFGNDVEFRLKVEEWGMEEVVPQEEPVVEEEEEEAQEMGVSLFGFDMDDDEKDREKEEEGNERKESEMERVDETEVKPDVEMTEKNGNDTQNDKTEPDDVRMVEESEAPEVADVDLNDEADLPLLGSSLKRPNSDDEYDEDADYDPGFSNELVPVPPLPPQKAGKAYNLEDYTLRSILKKDGEKRPVKRVRFNV